MAEKFFKTRIKQRQDISANWESKNPVLLNGEVIIVDTANGETRTKTGNGTKTYTQLLFDDEGAKGGKSLSTCDYTAEDKAEVAKVKNKVNTSDVLTKTNATEFTPTSDYHPATKKYVDDFINGAFITEYEINDSDGGAISDSDGQPILGRVDARVNVIDAVLKLGKKVERLEEAIGELKK